MTLLSCRRAWRGATFTAGVIALWMLVGAGGAVARDGGSTALVDAIKRGDRAAVRTLLRTQADLGPADGDGTTPLHWAVRANDEDLVQQLLQAGADPSSATAHGVTPLTLAAVNGSLPVTRRLLEAGASARETLPEGETVLMTAARTGRADVIAALIDAGADVHAREAWYGETALMWAAAENHPDAVAVLVARGADVNGRSTQVELKNRRAGQSILPLGGWTPLMYAARQNATRAAGVLLDAGADPDLTDPDGATAIVLAVINAHYDLAAFLLERGADPNAADSQGMAALYAAIDMHTLAVGHGRPNPQPSGRLNAIALVERLLAHGADPNARLTGPTLQRQHTAGDAILGAGSTPFMRAAKTGDVVAMRLLLAAGADPALTLPNQSTALMLASGLGWRDGSPAAPAYDQGTPADAVAAIALCLEAGLEVNATNASGDTALHAAVTGRGAPEIVRFLVEKGADLQARNKQGRTALELVESGRRERPELVALLRKLMS